ncbi:MAG: GHKL domain-containing protein [Spirochaetales bacterium]|nr:GHKL domain-containing protein [Spirochaetales bacterium]
METGQIADFHPVLRRQLQRYAAIDDLVSNHGPWLAWTDHFFKSGDNDRQLLERSLELTSDELCQRNLALQRGLSALETQRQALLRNETALQKSNVFLAGILSSISAGILVLDERCIVQFHNEQAATILDSTTSLTGRKFWQCLDTVTIPFLRQFKVIQKKEKSAVVFEIERRKGHPLTQYLRCSMTALSTEEGCNVVLVLEDVTLPRLTRQTLNQTAKLAMLGEMASGVVHQISQPLTVIQMAGEMLFECSQDSTINRRFLTERISSILDMTARARTTIAQLLLFARGADPHVGPLYISTVLQNAMVLLKDKIRLAGVYLSVDKPEKEPRIHGSANQLEQVFINILVNALDALAEKKGNREIFISCKLFIDQIEVRIENNGPPISDKTLNSIFQPFYTTKPEGQGTGLGLSVGLGIVQAHGGSLSVTSSEERTSFVVRLPVAAQKPSESVSFAKISSSGGGPDE